MNAICSHMRGGSSDSATTGLLPAVQLRHSSGQSVAPVYEGYDVNPDGSYRRFVQHVVRLHEPEL